MSRLASKPGLPRPDFYLAALEKNPRLRDKMLGEEGLGSRLTLDHLASFIPGPLCSRKKTNKKTQTRMLTCLHPAAILVTYRKFEQDLTLDRD